MAIDLAQRPTAPLHLIVAAAKVPGYAVATLRRGGETYQILYSCAPGDLPNPSQIREDIKAVLRLPADASAGRQLRRVLGTSSLADIFGAGGEAPHA